MLDPSEGGLGEEDFVTLTLPYLHSAFDGVKRVGYLVEKYGTYEMNGMAFSDKDNIWYLETIGGHHWIARRIPDDAYVIAPNRLNIDEFDFDDTDKEAKNLSGKELQDKLIAANQKMSDTVYNNTVELLGQMVDEGHGLMTLKYDLLD